MSRYCPRFIQGWTYIGPPAKGVAVDEKGTSASGTTRLLPWRNWRVQWDQEQAAVQQELQTACPLSEPCVEAFTESMPEEIKLLALRSARVVNPARLWTTLLCRSYLQTKHEHFLVEVRSCSRGPSWQDEESLLL
jgi:hypothetical protein